MYFFEAGPGICPKFLSVSLFISFPQKAEVYYDISLFTSNFLERTVAKFSVVPPMIGSYTLRYTEPVFVNLLRSPGIDSQPGGPVRQSMFRTCPPGYINWRNRFQSSIKVYKYGLCTVLCTFTANVHTFFCRCSCSSYFEIYKVHCTDLYIIG